jgi:UDP-glucose:(heptosyl)LPS alpha-1,3-glucosyltransferase
MRLAFALYKYFPFSGLARDFMRIATLAVEKGHIVDVYVMEWHGDVPPKFNVYVLKAKGWTNHGRVGDFHQLLDNRLGLKTYDAVIGFNKIPSVDVYYAADPCFAERFSNKHCSHRLNPRYRFNANVEKAVFGEGSATVCLMISDVQMALFKQHYQTPNDRLVMLPPGIDANRRRPVDAENQRKKFRNQLNISEQDNVVLMVGSAFKTKGVDRAIEALASLPNSILRKTHLLVVGEGDAPKYERLADVKSVVEHVHFMDGRTDIPSFLLSADLLLHPARKENTGTVILEAMVAGLPMLVTGVCGYAKHVEKSRAGKVLGVPFSHGELNDELLVMLTNDKQNWVSNALAYAETEDLYSMPEKAILAIEQVAARRKDAI